MPISKGKRLPGTLLPHRPLCMLDTPGKLLQKLFKWRLLQRSGNLSKRQYRFRRGQSTIDTIIQEIINAVKGKRATHTTREKERTHYSRRICIFGAINVKNAFNSAKWSNMIQLLEHNFRALMYLLRIIDNYLRDRVPQERIDKGTKTNKTIMSEIAQRARS